MSDKRTIGMWLYKNSGGDAIGKTIIEKLKERNIDTIDNIDLRYATAQNKNIIHVLNAPSPAATSSLAIGEYIANLVKI